MGPDNGTMMEHLQMELRIQDVTMQEHKAADSGTKHNSHFYAQMSQC